MYIPNKKLIRLKRWYIHKLGKVAGEILYNKTIKQRTLKYYCFRFGKVLGNQKYQNHKKMGSFSRTLNGYISRLGVEEGTIKYKEKNSKLSVGTESLKKRNFSDSVIKTIKDTHRNKSRHTLDNYIAKFGIELGQQKYNNYQNKSRVSVRSVKELMERKGYTLEQAKEKVKQVQTRTIDTFVEKHGNIQGPVLYDKYIKNKTSKLDNTTYSSIQINFACSLYEMINENNLDVIFSGLPFTPSKYIKFDKNDIDNYLKLQWCIPDIILSDKIIIEFDGEYYHSFQNIKEKDILKGKLLKKIGYSIIRISETDFRQKRLECIIDTYNKIKKIYENQKNS